MTKVFRHHVRMHMLIAAVIAVSGLQGVVTKGPTTPVCRAGRPCSAPAQVALLFHRSLPTARTFRTRSGTDGRYRIVLPPGTYTVSTAERIGITRIIRPLRVHVRADHVDRMNFSIDTGIR